MYSIRGKFIAAFVAIAVLMLTCATCTIAQSWDDDWYDIGGSAVAPTNNGDIYHAGGNVGIGTTEPVERLHIKYGGSDPGIRLENSHSSGSTWDIVSGCYEHGGGSGTTDQFGICNNKTGVLALTIEPYYGNVGIGTTEPDAKLTIQGEEVGGKTVILKGLDKDGNQIVEIGKGLDYSETFPTSQEQIAPGTVMVIDPVNAGFLAISTQPYDKKVAGVIAGANGLDSGVKLGTSADGDYAVALAGRAYCNVDTQYGDIEPGDLLTTSPTPGYAMVVKDFSKAQGAILGKAMEGLSGGRQGQILVLVTLQ